MARTRWTSEQIPDQSGRLAVVTGANSGIGKETARELARRGARVILACRDVDKGAAAAEEIGPDASGEVEVMRLDLADLSSVREFVGAFAQAGHDRLDLLICNGGVMMPPRRQETVDGFELQMGTNHLGHFALVGGLLDRCLATPGARIVAVSSNAHKSGVIELEDLHWQRRRFARWKSYSDSKLANLLFTYELQRRLTAMGAGVLATAAHPGWTATNLQQHVGVAQLFGFVAMAPRQGALPTLLAATSAEAQPAGYYGPDGVGELKGWPTAVRSTRRSHDLDLAARLWELSVELTGVEFGRLTTKPDPDP